MNGLKRDWTKAEVKALKPAVRMFVENQGGKVIDFAIDAPKDEETGHFLFVNVVPKNAEDPESFVTKLADNFALECGRRPTFPLPVTFLPVSSANAQPS